MAWLFAALCALTLAHYGITGRRRGLLTADGLFVASQLVMVFGTLRLVDEQSPVEVYYARVMVLGVATYIVASLLVFLAAPRREFAVIRSEPINVTPPNRGLVIAIVVALVATTAYCVAVGYSAFLLGLRGVVSGQLADVATLRLESYAGARYLFPGYANQFKNVILPALAVLVVTWAHTSRAGAPAKVASWALAAVSALGLLWTGQRGAFVAFLITVVIYLYMLQQRRFSRALLVPLAVGAPLALLATVVLARGTSAARGLLDRFLNDNQQSGIAGFRYTFSQPIQDGAEWLHGLAGILPGDRGSTLSSEIFATVYGSSRGTAPPSLWGSIHYNFGTFGVIVVAVLLGALLQYVSHQSTRPGPYNTLQLIGIAGVAVVLGTWVAGGPDTLLNTGLLAYLGLWYWGSRR